MAGTVPLIVQVTSMRARSPCTNSVTPCLLQMSKGGCSSCPPSPWTPRWRELARGRTATAPTLTVAFLGRLLGPLQHNLRTTSHATSCRRWTHTRARARAHTRMHTQSGSQLACYITCYLMSQVETVFDLHTGGSSINFTPMATFKGMGAHSLSRDRKIEGGRQRDLERSRAREI